MVCILALNLAYNKTKLYTIDLEICSILIFRRGSRNSFLTIFCIWFLKKIFVPHVTLYEEGTTHLQCTSFCTPFHYSSFSISNHSHEEWKQPQIIFLSYSYSVTMNIVKKYMWRKTHEVNILIETSNDS